METENYRIATFKAWPYSLSVIPMARSGLYYSGTGDKVICYKCKVEFENWISDKNVIEKHKGRSPGCGETSNSIGLGNEAATNIGTSNAPDSQAEAEGAGCQQLKELYNSALSRASTTNGRLDNTRPDYGKLRDEEARLKTFYNWPHSAHADPRELAREGLFYTGANDRVQCVFCQGYIRNWEPGDVPSVEHKKHFPECPFVLGLDVGNNPINKLLMMSAGAFPNQNSTANNIHNVDTLISQSIPDTSRRHVREQTHLLAPADTTESPKFPQYFDLSCRVESFKRGIVSAGQTSKVLSEAGFFYTGPGDKVKCFQCGGNLKDWQPDDDPWEQHKKWYPSCLHLKTRLTSKLSAHKPPASQNTLFPVEPREIKARMDTATVRAILNMGYNKELVRRAIEIRLKTKGDDFPNAESLLEQIFALQEEEETTPQASASNDFTHFSNSVALPEPQTLSLSAESSFAQTQLSVPTLSAVIAAASPANSSESAVEMPTKSKGKKKKNKKKKTEAATNGEEQEQEESQTKDTVDPEILPGHEATLDTETLEYVEEIRRLRDERTCKVCMDAEVNTVFLPCGHLVCCDKCAPAMRNCPICRTYVRGTVKTFLS